MEIVIVILMLGIAALVGAAAVYIPREIERNQLHRGWTTGAEDPGVAQSEKLTAQFEAELERFRTEAARAFASIISDFEMLRGSLRESVDEQSRHVDTLRLRSTELDGESVARVEAALRELSEHHHAELDRVVTAFQLSMGERAVEVTPIGVSTPQQMQALANLSNRLAALTSSVTMAINPELLPGERLESPVSLRQETLAWENWKEVGDTAFSFAQAFASERVLLDPAVEDELETFVSNVRTLLTRGIYPNLQHMTDDPTALAKTQEAVNSLTIELLQARRCLATAIRGNAVA